MAVSGTRATTYIITKLGCDTACGGMITAAFDLACLSAPPRDSGYHSMGSIPLEPGEIHNVFHPVNLNWDEPYLVPVDRNFIKNKIVVITIEVNNKEKTTEFGVNPAKPSKNAVSVLNAENVTRSMKSVTIDNLSKKTTKAGVTISKVRRVMLVKNK